MKNSSDSSKEDGSENLYIHFRIQYVGFSANWGSIYLKTQLYLNIKLKDVPSYHKDAFSTMFLAALKRKKLEMFYMSHN